MSISSMRSWFETDDIEDCLEGITLIKEGLTPENSLVFEFMYKLQLLLM